MMKCKLCPLHMVAAVLVIVGALNWGLVGAFNFNLVKVLLGSWPMVESLVYILVGLAGVAMLFACHCKKCGQSCCKDGSCGMPEKKV